MIYSMVSNDTRSIYFGDANGDWLAYYGRKWYTTTACAKVVSQFRIPDTLIVLKGIPLCQ